MPVTASKQGKGNVQGTRASRGRGLRTNTGCLTCRRRHLKCDEARPVCHTCTRNNKACVYADGQRGTMARSTPASGDDVDSTSHARLEESLEPCASLSENQSHRPAQRRDQQYSTSQPRPDSSDPALGGDPIEQASFEQQDTASQPPMPISLPQLAREQRSALGSPPPLHNLPQFQGSRVDTVHSSGVRDGLGGATYTSPASVGTASDQPIGIATARWFGMLVDDADLPMDADCQLTTSVGQEGYRLVGDDQSSSRNEVPSGLDPPVESATLVIHPDYSAVAPRLEQQRPAEELLWQSAEALSMQPHETNLFQTFVRHISAWMDLFDPYTHFASLVPRLALYNTGLLSAILALSVRHDSLGLRPDFARHDALQYYHRTLQYVQKAMQYTSYHTSLELLATTLIISAYEMLDGSSRDWERHLQGVFWIQRSQRIHGDSDGLRAAVWWAWLCQDTWAAFRDRRKVFSFWKPERTLAELSTAQLANRSVFILGRVINYCAQNEFDDSASGILSKLQTAERLSAMLDEWESLLTPDFLPLPHNHQNSSSTFESIWIHPPMYAVSVQVHHAARILVLLNKPSLGGIDQGLQRQSTLDKHVGVICGIALMLTDYASGTMSSQCLFVAGLCTHDRRRRREVLVLLADCRARTGWPVMPLEEELQRHWQVSTTDWADSAGAT